MNAALGREALAGLLKGTLTQVVFLTQCLDFWRSFAFFILFYLQIQEMLLFAFRIGVYVWLCSRVIKKWGNSLKSGLEHKISHTKDLKLHCLVGGKITKSQHFTSCIFSHRNAYGSYVEFPSLSRGAGLSITKRTCFRFTVWVYLENVQPWAEGEDLLSVSYDFTSPRRSLLRKSISSVEITRNKSTLQKLYFYDWRFNY